MCCCCCWINRGDHFIAHRSLDLNSQIRSTKGKGGGRVESLPLVFVNVRSLSLSVTIVKLALFLVLLVLTVDKSCRRPDRQSVFKHSKCVGNWRTRTRDRLRDWTD